LQRDGDGSGLDWGRGGEMRRSEAPEGSGGEGEFGERRYRGRWVLQSVGDESYRGTGKDEGEQQGFRSSARCKRAEANAMRMAQTLTHKLCNVPPQLVQLFVLTLSLERVRLDPLLSVRVSLFLAAWCRWTCFG
jgi:hypothetical protein